MPSPGELWWHLLSRGVISHSRWLMLEGLAMLAVAQFLNSASESDPAAGPVSAIFFLLGIWHVGVGYRAERDVTSKP